MPLTRTGNVARDSPHNATPPGTGAKRATVTMMLAQRMARNDWSVDDEHFFESNTMNVWQTLEFLSGINLRKRYHYEGYNDTDNRIRTLTPSWRRDSFIENNVLALAGKDKDAGVKYQSELAIRDFGNLAAGTNTRGGVQEPKNNAAFGGLAAETNRTGSRKKTRNKNKKKNKNKNQDILDLEAEYTQTDLVKCNFNLPRISAALERLMGTNVVRLTDRKYMKELRQRIEEDYRQTLLKRIKSRELKEVERERLLIIEGKTDVIPEELADDPIFLVNKTANKEIQKKRAKLKTNRERNAEHLKVQGIKWERERLQHEDEERERLLVIAERRKEQAELEQRYKDEDAERGMDLLRIDNEEWRPCEQKLKEFLERERAKMKERSYRVPTPFSSDKLDIQNIVRARQKFRETEQRIRQELEEKFRQDKMITPSKEFSAKSEASRLSKMLADEEANLTETDQHKQDRDPSMHTLPEPMEEEQVVKKYNDDVSDISSEEELVEVGSSISQSKRRHAAALAEEAENDVQRGLLISREQYKHLRYEEDKILQLRHAKTIRELYELAEQIIVGDRFEEEAAEEDEEEAPYDAEEVAIVEDLKT